MFRAAEMELHPFEFDFATQFVTWCGAMRGNITQSRVEVGGLIRDAVATGNRFLEVALRSFMPRSSLVKAPKIC